MSCIRFVLFATVAMVTLSCSKHEAGIIPEPMQLTNHKGHFNIVRSTRIVANPVDSSAYRVAQYLQNLLMEKGLALDLASPNGSKEPNNYILLSSSGFADSLGREGYTLTVTRNGIAIHACSGAGFFYAIQTLRQLFPANFETPNPGCNKLSVGIVEVVDKPRFSWRGLNLDCCRHFMSKEFVKRYIDLLAYHKMNVLHWHLTDDQGWRVEIKKYPRLTDVGAWRLQPDGSTYGGYYTQNDIREIVAYAAERYVNIVPEIEMPGHSVAALASYPELSCTGLPLAVETQWGVFKDIFCAGNEQTYVFLEDVLTEIVGLFPFGYIHIGGDEAPKYRWENCPKCQEKLKEQKITSYEELQQYFTTRIANFLATQNRQVVGWDEILKDPLPKNVTIQAWRGIDRVDSALATGIPVVVSPTSNCYFDYPLSVTDLQKAYSFNPIPVGVGKKQAGLILGGECNMWTEYAPQETIDSKLFPRMLAISEVLWTPSERQNYGDFLARVRRHYARLSSLGVMYGLEDEAFSIKCQLAGNGKSVVVKIEPGQENIRIRYTVNGELPTIKSKQYTKPLTFDRTTTIRVAAFMGDSLVGDVVTRTFALSLSTGKEITLGFSPSLKYLGGGVNALVDGRIGTTSYNDGIWQSVQGGNMVATVDLGSIQPVKSVSVGFLQSTPSWIFLPVRVDVWTSSNGQDFKMVSSEFSAISPKEVEPTRYSFSIKLQSIPCRYVRVVAHNMGRCPDWHPAAGSPSWLFADELMVE